MTWTLANLLAATAGRAAVGFAPQRTFEAVSTDSRRPVAGAVYFALRGVNFDGHTYVAEALERGAIAAVVDSSSPLATHPACIAVASVESALGDFAGWVRSQLGLRVIAITGSNGKTTTKELVASVCAAGLGDASGSAVLKTEGNLNNLIGLPLTLLRAVGDEAVAVLEMGMNQPGEIGRLREIARPDVALITNVGRAHLQGVGSLAGVAAAKGELFAGLPPSATIVVNLDDEWVRRIAAPFVGRRVTYGAGGDVSAERIMALGLDGFGFDLRIGDARAHVRLGLIGEHNVRNAVAAAAVGHALGFPIDRIASALTSRPQVSMRMQPVRLANQVTVINDAYNANPNSVEAALLALQRLRGRCVVVLGGMQELGDESRHAHREIGARVAALGMARLVTVGELAAEIGAGALAAGMDAESVAVCADTAQAAAAVQRIWAPGDVVLVKGSRAMKMEEVVRLLESAGKPG